MARDPVDTGDALLTFKEAMGYLHVSRSTLTRLIEEEKIDGYKVRSTWRFFRSDLDHALKRQKKELD